MKFTFGIFLTLAVAASVQGSVTEGLLAAQVDLALGHRFFETAIFMNRAQISSYLLMINREIVESHINTYAFIKTLGLEGLDEIERVRGVATDDFQRDCVERINTRWELQKFRYGHGLAQCVQNVDRLLQSWNVFINGLHATAQLTGNQVQNTGVSVLSHTSTFDGHEDFPVMINRAYRELLKHYLSYRDRFDGFLSEISADVVDTIRDLISCDTVLEENFQREIETDMARARGCVGETGTDAPIPT